MIELPELKTWMARVNQRALSTTPTLWASYAMAADALDRGVHGDVVECGVYAGSQAAAMARAVLEREWSGTPGRYTAHTGRRVHLFDAFTGIPQAGLRDAEFLEAGHKAGLSACSADQVKQHMAEWWLPSDMFYYRTGLFADSVPKVVAAGGFPSGIAVLRLDGDLYRSTKDCTPLIDLVNVGGWIIVDDWNLSGCRQAIIEDVGYPHPIYFQQQPKG